MQRALITYACLAMLLSFGLASVAFAQTGAITGTVKDQSGAVLPGVTITITNTETNAQRSFVTDENGDYIVTVLPVGTYRLEAGMTGFKKGLAENIKLNVNDKLRIDLALEAGQVSDSVVVTGAAPLVQSETSSVGNVIDHQKVVELPLNGRRFESLAQLVPGVVAVGANAFSASGARTTSNNFILDGIDNNDPAVNSFTLRPIVDSIQEFKVQTNSYTAEFGRGGGANIQVNTKAGTNKLHGGVWEFIRNDALDARGFFADPLAKKPPFRRNQFGGTLGGPVRRDRTFFFGAYESLRLRQQVSSLQSVPSLQFRAGDFSALTAALRDPVRGGTFAGNKILLDRIHPAALRVLDRGSYPAPTPGLAGASNLRAVNPFPDDVDQFSARIDHRLTRSNNLFGRYSFTQDNQQAPCSGGGAVCIPGYPLSAITRAQSLSLVDTHVFTTRLVNELRVGFNRQTLPRIALTSKAKGGRNVGAELGIPGLPASQDPNDWGFPTLSITGFGTIGDAGYQTRAGTTYDLSDIIDYTAGRHSIRAGFEMRRMGFNAQIGRARDALSFDGRFTGNAFADFLLGFPSQTQRNAEDFPRYRRINSYNWFVQDDLKVRDNLTLNLGLRYEFNTPDVEVFDRLVNVNTETFQYEIANRNGASRALYRPDLNNFAPRIGFAYRPTRSSNFVIRAGYGVFYDLFAQGNQIGPTRQGPPFFKGETFSASTNPRDLTLSDPFPAGRLQPSDVFNIRAIQTGFRDGYVQQWNLGVQKEILPNVVFEIGYLGSKGTHLFRVIDINQAFPGSGSVQSRRPLQQYGSVEVLESSGSSIFHALVSRIERRFAGGLSLLASYTYGHAIDDSSGELAAIGQDARNLRAERGNSNFDARQRLALSYIYQLPFGQGKRFGNHLPAIADALLGGWQVSGITVFQSGLPLTPAISGQRNQTGVARDRPNATGIDPIFSDQ
ncbi:MAG: TonB-dependent receptor domain-containing protein, partial [Blastocatellia bacterium]